MFANQQQPSPSIASTGASQRTEVEPTIVGPSDHYGVHHQFRSSSNNLTNNGIGGNRGGLPSGAHFLAQDHTKVCVIVDSKTPVIVKVALPPTQITLADLKQAFPAINKPNYRYFFKTSDSEYGIVKEQIEDDDSILPTFRSRVVAWIVTPNGYGDELASKTRSEVDTCNLTYSNTSYDDGSSSLFTTDMDSTSYFTETDDDSISCSNYSETTCDTLISQRRNRHYQKNGKASHSHDYHDHDRPSNSPYRYGAHDDRAKDLDSISHSSSQSSSSASHSNATEVRLVTVHLMLTNENFLGLHICANSDAGDEGIFVEAVTENSAVAIDGRIEPRDKIVQVNEISLEELSDEQAVRVLKEAVVKRGPLKLVVAKFIETNKPENMDELLGSKDGIHPIDTAAWVAHAQAITMPNNLTHANSAASSPSFGSNAQDTDCIRPASVGISRLNSGLRLNRSTTDTQEIIHHMKMPEVGLEIKDREWLKIHIPMAFLGSDLVTWLGRNVYGFNSTRDAKKFASRLLKDGYIRDPISKNSFSSKSYYTFAV